MCNPFPRTGPCFYSYDTPSETYGSEHSFCHLTDFSFSLIFNNSFIYFRKISAEFIRRSSNNLLFSSLSGLHLVHFIILTLYQLSFLLPHIHPIMAYFAKFRRKKMPHIHMCIIYTNIQSTCICII